MPNKKILISFIISLVALIGVVSQKPADTGSWLLAGAFLVIAIFTGLALWKK